MIGGYLLRVVGGGIFLVLGCMQVGCSEVGVLPASEPVVVAGDKDELWRVCQDEVKGRGFRLDMVDLRSGVIATYPLVSSQWFEFWRRDVVSNATRLESSLHTVRRRVHLELKAQDTREYRLVCRVEVERFSSPPRITGGTVRVQKTFSRTSRLGRDTDAIEDKQRWIRLGGDPALEADILNSIKMTLRRKETSL